MSDSKTIYVLDTTSWLTIEGHPAQNQILNTLGRLILEGRIKGPRQVLEEMKKCATVLEWLNQHKDIVFDAKNTPDYLLLAGRVTHQFPAMAGARTKKNRADPWVVALAIDLAHSPPATVVVEETTAKRKNRKIPTACKHFDVPCMSLIEMLKAEAPDEDW